MPQTYLKRIISTSTFSYFTWFSHFSFSFISADDFNTMQERVTWIGLAYQQPRKLNWQPISANKPQHILTVPAIVCFCHSGNSEESVLEMNHTLVLQI